MPEAEVYDVIIVGLGPAGAAAANAAGALGLRTLVVERDLEIFERQRAIALDDEALRVMRGLGLFDEVTEHMHLGITARFVGADGKPFLSTPSAPTAYTGYSLANFFHQPALEHALREGLKRFPCVQVRAGWTASLVGQGEHAVTLELTDEEDQAVRVSGRYVLACDGGSSPLRKQVGIPFAGTSYAEQWMDVQARVKRPLHRPPHFDFVCSPERPGVRCPCPGGYYRWEWRINPGEDADAMLSEDNIWRMLAAEGVSPDDIEIARTWNYTFHVRKAQRWRVGRVLLLGDAAHVMPPFAGQGISGAFRDAANAVWKVDAVVRGRAGDALLDTYQTEREPHHDAMTQRAVTFGKIVMTQRPWVAWLLCLVPAAMKLSGSAKMRSAAQHFDIPWAWYQLIGGLELAAAATVVFGVFWRPAGFLAAIGMTVLLACAVILHRRAGDTVHEYAAALVFLAASAGYLAVWLCATPRV